MIDERLFAEVDLLKNDLAVACQKLESKSQAVVIVHDALRKCQEERDEFKRMAEQVMNRYQLLKRTLGQGSQWGTMSVKGLSQLSTKQLASLLVESREANSALQQELTDMKLKLRDTMGDVRLLREQLKARSPDHSPAEHSRLSAIEKQHVVLYIEKLTEQIKELQQELARCSDEKQELIIERDIYRNKCDRLNNELNYILNGDERKIVDIDALIMEKKSIKYRLDAVEEEKRLAMATLSKYQRIIERKMPKSSSVSSDCPFTPNDSPSHFTNVTSCKADSIRRMPSTDSDQSQVTEPPTNSLVEPKRIEDI
ncbi:hypothetical protein EG68_05891 [Paragonimus skrjabini miyazakii]|uniref:Coiled-coil domain-containing protein 149 n=1 Tax=Paragonimus skrjabini miyazakii TaxID=59628 RepID=A0A8S9YPS1_9TREM|nr:hypothetical protein EG68_05891 [Paragonimus skrjabini miyazakii]